jgi:hypothetical protein
VSRVVRGAAAVAGLAVVGLAGAWALAAGTAAPPETLGRVLAALVGLLAVAVAVGRTWAGGDGPAADPPVASAPERAPDDRPVAGRAFATQVREATERARARDAEAGVAAVRPALRATLVAVRRRAGDDPETVERELDAGTWTDDPVAAAALSETVAPPERSLRRRLADWLRPDRAARRRVRRATDAVARVADDRLPAVPGADAPRPAPAARPTLGDLRRAVDGTLEPVGGDGSPAADDGDGGPPS